jgi:hypothetical protein
VVSAISLQAGLSLQDHCQLYRRRWAAIPEPYSSAIFAADAQGEDEVAIPLQELEVPADSPVAEEGWFRGLGFSRTNPKTCEEQTSILRTFLCCCPLKVTATLEFDVAEVDKLHVDLKDFVGVPANRENKQGRETMRMPLT